MEGGGRSRLSRLLNKLRGDHHKFSLDKGISFMSAVMSESTACGSSHEEADANVNSPQPEQPSSSVMEDDQFAANVDLRYGGQYLTPDQLPEFCEQLHHLVEVIRNIQSYAHVTGEYPAELENRLEREAREVSSLASEARHARDVVTRVRTQRHALASMREHLKEQLAGLKDTEIRELEGAVRLSDRKLYKNWESLKDTTDPSAFDTLLEEIRSKQAALECLLRLINSKRTSLLKPSSPHPLPAPLPRDSNDDLFGVESNANNGSGLRKLRARRGKRRRTEPRSAPLSGESSAHNHLPQVTLYIQGSDAATRRAGSVPVTPLELPSGGSVRDILFFTTNTS